MNGLYPLTIKDKISGIFAPIFTDIENTILWGGAIIAALLLLVCVVKWYSAEDSVDRKQQVSWMRVIILGYIGLQLVTWLLTSYLDPKV